MDLGMAEPSDNRTQCLPHRAEGAASTLSDPTSPAPAEVASTPATAALSRALAVPPGPRAAVSTAAPAVSIAAALGTATGDR